MKVSPKSLLRLFLHLALQLEIMKSQIIQLTNNYFRSTCMYLDYLESTRKYLTL